MVEPARPASNRCVTFKLEPWPRLRIIKAGFGIHQSPLFLFNAGVKPTATALLLLLASCASDPNRIPGPATKVTREQTLAIASAYQRLQWSPTEANVLHGRDADGIRVDTPDESLGKFGHKNGWWKPDHQMQGMPYKWGGFDTPREFLLGVKQGMAAGDIATYEKRRLDEAAVSRHVAGIDCSGFISRCWRLNRQYSTDEFHQICTPLRSAKELKAGDIMLGKGHVLMFSRWDSMRLDHLIVYEATRVPTWRVNRGSISLERLKKNGYRPWRYRNIVD